MQKFKAVFYFANVWPKNNFSAACERVKQIHDSIGRYDDYTVHFIAPQKMPKVDLVADELKYVYTKKHRLDPNEIFETKQRLKQILKNQKVELAIFDTFIAEEFYSIYARELKEQLVHVLDTQDLHFVRKTRQKNYENFVQEFGYENLDLKKLLKFEIDLKDQQTSRELNSIFRSDLVMVCSDFEQRLLQKKFNLQNLFVQRFDYTFGNKETDTIQLDYSYKNFHQKRNFVWIGNFQHEPNFEAVKLLRDCLWPKIQQKLPNVELHIYGSNFPKEFEDIEKVQGIKKKNLMRNLKLLSKYRLLLAPLFFGAGIKGYFKKQNM